MFSRDEIVQGMMLCRISEDHHPVDLAGYEVDMIVDIDEETFTNVVKLITPPVSLPPKNHEAIVLSRTIGINGLVTSMLIGYRHDNCYHCMMLFGDGIFGE